MNELTHKRSTLDDLIVARARFGVNSYEFYLAQLAHQRETARREASWQLRKAANQVMLHGRGY